jgi:MFS family permease
VGPAAAWRVIRSRRFGPYFAGNATSASGTWFQNLAALILVARLTHSAFWLGFLNFSQFVPVLLLAPLAGSVADRFDRRRVLLLTQLAAAATSGALAGFAWAGEATLAVVIAFSAAMGVTSAFSSPLQQALITALVDDEDVPQAVALNSMTFNLARAVGPTLATAVIVTLGIPWAFALNSASFLLLAAALLVIRPRPQERSSRRSSLRESFGLIRADPRLGAFLLIVMCVGFASDPVNTEAPKFAAAFGYGDTWSGIIVGFFGAGAVTAALLVAGRVAGTRGRMATTLAVMGVGVILFSVTPWLPLAFAFLFCAGFGYLSSNTAATARLQLGVAESQRGRIMALWSIAFLGLRPVASLTDGALAGAFGVRVAGTVLAIPALLGAAAVLFVRAPRR